MQTYAHSLDKTKGAWTVISSMQKWQVSPNGCCCTEPENAQVKQRQGKLTTHGEKNFIPHNLSIAATMFGLGGYIRKGKLNCIVFALYHYLPVDNMHVLLFFIIARLDAILLLRVRSLWTLIES